MLHPINRSSTIVNPAVNEQLGFATIEPPQIPAVVQEENKSDEEDNHEAAPQSDII